MSRHFLVFLFNISFHSTILNRNIKSKLLDYYSPIISYSPVYSLVFPMAAYLLTINWLQIDVSINTD